MDSYEKALTIWQDRHVETDAELAEALNGHSIYFGKKLSAQRPQLN